MGEFLPPGVFNVVCGDRDTGRALVTHPVPQMVSITGSVRAGREVAAAAAADLKRVHLELGGKAPVIVFDDADPAKTAEAIAIAGLLQRRARTAPPPPGCWPARAIARRPGRRPGRAGPAADRGRPGRARTPTSGR